MRKVWSICVALLLLISMAVPASAEVIGFLYEETKLLPEDDVYNQILRMNEVSLQADIPMEMNIINYCGDAQFLSRMADLVYENKEQPPEDYITLWVQVTEDEDGLHLSEDAPWHLKLVGCVAEDTAFARNLQTAMEALITDENWSGPLAEDTQTVMQISDALIDAVSRFDAKRKAPPTPCVIDDAELLTLEQRQELNAFAEEITAQYGIGVYMMSVADFRDYGEESEIYDVLWNYYHDNGLGFGEDREGMILMLSMAERDFATFYYGENTEYAFNGFGQEQQEAWFLDNFGDDDWYGGFRDYLRSTGDFLAKAAAGEPVRENPWHLALVFILIALFIAFVVTRLLWMKMSNVALQTSAGRYRAAEGFVLTHSDDIFLNQTVRRRKIESSDSGSGKSGSSRAHSGGGGSGRSGKF